MDRIITNVLIIGGGGAACRAAIAACDAGADVLIVSKKPLGKGGATTFPVAEMAGYNAGDPSIPGDIEKHYQDMIDAGQGVADKKLVSVLAEEAPGTIEVLEKWGVKFEKEGSGYYIFKSCFSSSPRTHVIRGHGEPIVNAMKRQIARRASIRIMEGITVIELIVSGGQCFGAWGINQEGSLCLMTAGAVVLATGGASQAFLKNMNPNDVGGDGYLLAYQAGAELMNMEFMQAGIGFSYPVFNIFNGYIWAAHPKLTNGNGETFLSKYLPGFLSETQVMDAHRKHFPFSSDDESRYLEAGIQKELLAGGCGAHGGVCVDLRHLEDSYVNSIPDDCGLHHMWPVAREYMKGKGVDLLSERAELEVFAQSTNGGVRIDEKCASTIPGLYAVGEVAGGPHGANRLGGNMMVTCQVFGRRAGRHAAEWARCQGIPGVVFDQRPQLWELLHKTVDSAEKIRGLQEINQKYLLVCRSEEGLRRVLAHVTQELQNLWNAPVCDELNLDVYKLYSLLVSAEMMASAALERRESRGAHYREDYTERDEALSAPIIQKKSRG